MSTQGIFDNFMTTTIHSEVESPKQLLWRMTWRRIKAFLPNFIQDLFRGFIPPTSTESTSTTGDSRSDEITVEESDLHVSDSGGAAARSSPVAVPAQVVSGGNSSPPPGPGVDVGSPSRSPYLSSITGMQNILVTGFSL